MPRPHFLISLSTIISLIAIIGSFSALSGAGHGPTDRTWQGIHDKKQLVVGVDISFPPFGIYNDSEPLGIDPDIAREIASRLGVELRFVLVTYDGMFDMLYRGEIDIIIAALRPDNKQLDRFRYTHAYYDAGTIFIGLAEQALPTHFKDLAGKTLAVEFASEGDDAAQQALAAQGGNFTLIQSLSVDEAIEAVLNGSADYALVDSISARLAARQHDTLQIADKPLISDPYVMALRRNDWRLFLALEDMLQKHTAIFEAIIARWL